MVQEPFLSSEDNPQASSSGAVPKFYSDTMLSNGGRDKSPHFLELTASYSVVSSASGLSSSNKGNFFPLFKLKGRELNSFFYS